MSKEIIIRQADPRDLEALADLFDRYRQFYGQMPDLSAARAFLEERMAKRESVIFLAIIEGEPAGFTQLYPSFSSTRMARIFILNDLFVAATARRAGIGRLLLAEAEAYGRSAGALRLSLSTALTNHPAKNLYEKAGWRQDDVFCTYNLMLG